MAIVLTNRKYSDIDLDFFAHPVTKDVVKKTDAEAVKRAIRYLVYTQHFERPFQPGIGCKVYRLLFEPMNYITTIEIQKSIEEVLFNYEPRIAEYKINVIPNYDENRYDIEINFTIKNVNLPIVVTFYLERTR